MAEGAALCVQCHDDHAADPDRKVPHAAVSEGVACLNCHSPHSGKTASLLVRDDLVQTCQSCHDRQRFEREYRHPETDCVLCHDPHGSGNRDILTEPEADLCLTCHEDSKERHLHPIGAPARDPRTGEALACTSCHDPHSADYRVLLRHDPERDLCVQCHAGQNYKVRSRGGG